MPIKLPHKRRSSMSSTSTSAGLPSSSSMSSTGTSSTGTSSTGTSSSSKPARPPHKQDVTVAEACLAVLSDAPMNCEQVFHAIQHQGILVFT